MIYFMQADIGGPIKIGYCGEDKLDQRVKALQTYCPFPLVVRKTIPGASRGIEKRLHRAFAPERLHGEWFYASPMLVALADAVGVEDMEGMAFQMAEEILEREVA